MPKPTPAQIDRILRVRSPEDVLAAAAPLLGAARRARIEAALDGRLVSVAVAMEAPSDPHNAAAVVRTAEALGVLDVHVVAAEGRALHARKITQGAYHWVRAHHHDRLDALVDWARAGRIALYGAAMDGALALDELPLDRPVCLLLGNEQRGLSSAARDACAGCFRIPMVGMSESLNLSVSAAIAMYEHTRRRRAWLGRAGDLPPAERERLRARYCGRSVDTRLLRAALGLGGEP